MKLQWARARLPSTEANGELSAEADAFAGHALVVLSEPTTIDRVQAAVAALGGAERQAIGLVVMPREAIPDAAYYLRAGIEAAAGAARLAPADDYPTFLTAVLRTEEADQLQSERRDARPRSRRAWRRRRDGV